ncbi:succinylglutamate desuccinylase [Massilia sp. PDC64]|nr:succinylglutamate desuccinylase [Massilia sp. PDC64]SDE74618.1 succinylglutamate desuccinylase [Massilia sp. PDC64]
MTAPSFDTLPAPVRALATGDVGAFAAPFAAAGFMVATPARGVLTIRTAAAHAARPAVLLSVGVHGDETGPIEIIAWILDALAQAPRELAVDLMVCVAHVDAIAAGRRFIDADLNRMFRTTRHDLVNTVEAARADELVAATAAFFDASGPMRLHLDLHTAIRASRYPAFALVPALVAQPARDALVAWLGTAGTEAVILNPTPGGTYSYWTAAQHGAAASTVELGRVGALGGNDLVRFDAAHRAVAALLRGRPRTEGPAPLVFDTVRTITKLSPGFSMRAGRDTANFTPLHKGDVTATDGGTVYMVEQEGEYLVFPNPDVRVGLRAGIVVRRRGA